MTTRTPEHDFARYRDAGDLTALAAVFDAVAGELLLIAGHLVRDGATAEDLVQTTFVEAMRSAARYDASRPLVPWLAQILTHHARKLQRRRRRDREGPRPRAGQRTPAQQLLDRETMAAIESGLARLRQPYREVLTLRLVHELSPAAIAHALGCPPETVKTRLKRGLEFLRRGLPAGLATSLGVLLASGRGLAAVRTDVLLHARHAATRTSAVGAAAGGAFVLGGMLMKQLAAWAAIAVVLVLSIWWSLRLRDDPSAPRAVDDRAAVATAAIARPDEVAAEDRSRAPSDTASPAGGIVFTGRCIDAESGAPLANVDAVAFVERSRLDETLCDNELGAETPAARAVSAADGRFDLRCERRPGASFAVRIGSRDHVHRVRTFGPYGEDRVVDLGDVPTARGVRVSLTVVDRRGAPVPNVRVTASASAVLGRNTMLEQDCGFPWRSDIRGEIHLAYAMPAGHYDVTWWSEEGIPTDRWGAGFDVPSGVADHHVKLVWPVDDGSQSIHGDVRDGEGRPVALLPVFAEGAGTRGNARTLRDGTFHMARIEPYDAAARGPVVFALPDALCGLELVAPPVCSWGDGDVHLTVRPTATLIVRAIDAATGSPVTDFDLACAAHREAGAPPTVVATFRPLERHADGSTSRRLARYAHDVQVFPKDRRLAPSPKITWDPRGGDTLTVALQPLRTCTVHVVTMDGAPIAGTEVFTLQPIEAVPGTSAGSGWREVAMPSPEDPSIDATTRWLRNGIDDAPLGRARTGADGRARVPVPADCDVVIAALGPGHVPKAVVGSADGESEVDLRVARGATVHLVLSPAEVARRLARSPLQHRLVAAGVHEQDPGCGGVSLEVVRSESERTADSPDDPRSVPLEPDGTCTVTGLAPGRHDLALSGYIESGQGDGIHALWQCGSVTVREGEAQDVPVDVSRWALGRLQGTVLVNGEPWRDGNADLWCNRWPESRTMIPVRTDGRGRFDVEATAGDSFHLLLRGVSNDLNATYCISAETVRVGPGEVMPVVFTARNVTARVRIVDANGDPAAGVVVSTDYVTNPQSGPSWTTDADGWITMHVAPPVPFHLVARNPNGPARAGRRNLQSLGDALLGPFTIPAIGNHVEWRAQLPAGWP